MTDMTLLTDAEIAAVAGGLTHPRGYSGRLQTEHQLIAVLCLGPACHQGVERVLRLAGARPTRSPRRNDVVHFDLNPANILHEHRRLVGIVDWNVPFHGASQGDCGFDLATLLFYTYENDATRDELWQAAVATSGIEWTVVYLAHLVLRQVEWTARHRPRSDEERRFIGIAMTVLDDCEQLVA